MCRLVVWNMARAAAADPRKEAGRLQPGMVVSVLPDGMDPGAEVTRRGWWKIIEVPGVPPEDFDYLTHPMPADIDAKNLPRPRWKILGAGFVASNKPTRSIAEVKGAERVADYLRNEAGQIGDDPRVIG
jgi:hypothetical protein